MTVSDRLDTLTHGSYSRRLAWVYTYWAGHRPWRNVPEILELLEELPDIIEGLHPNQLPEPRLRLVLWAHRTEKLILHGIKKAGMTRNPLFECYADWANALPAFFDEVCEARGVSKRVREYDGATLDSYLLE